MRLLLTGGGTAGHINPAIAIAKYAQSVDKNCEILFVGKNGGMESRLVPAEGFNIEYVDVEGFSRKLGFSTVSTVLKLVGAIGKASKIIKDFKPDAVIGTGGYVCVPAVVAANRKGIPTLIHEQNVFPGSAIKMLSKKSTITAISFEESKKYLGAAKNVVLTGNPVRQSLLSIDRNSARKKLGIEPDEKYIVAFGGSLGAKKINEVISQYIAVINNKKGIKLCFATGINNYDAVINDIKKSGITIGDNIDIRKYIDNMDVVMNAADLVISRSGAITVSELCVLGIPSILVPSPYVTNNHQEFNARALSDKSASTMILEKDFNIESLLKEAEEILYGKAQIMSVNAMEIGQSDATEIIYKQLKNVIS